MEANFWSTIMDIPIPNPHLLFIRTAVVIGEKVT